MNYFSIVLETFLFIIFAIFAGMNLSNNDSVKFFACVIFALCIGYQAINRLEYMRETRKIGCK